MNVKRHTLRADDRCKFLTYVLRDETLPFISDLSPLASGSSAALVDEIRRSRRQWGQSADGGDVGASLRRQRVLWRRVCVTGVCPTRVCVPASSEPASRERPSSHVSWGLV